MFMWATPRWLHQAAFSQAINDLIGKSSTETPSLLNARSKF
ncbi:hypothetical protein ABMA08_16820 [Pseudomonas yamanorum]